MRTRELQLLAGLCLAASSLPVLADGGTRHMPEHSFTFNRAGQVDWTGFYAGTHSGGVSGKTKFNRIDVRRTNPALLPGAAGANNPRFVTTASNTGLTSAVNPVTILGGGRPQVDCPPGSPAGAYCVATQLVRSACPPGIEPSVGCQSNSYTVISNVRQVGPGFEYDLAEVSRTLTPFAALANAVSDYREAEIGVTREVDISGFHVGPHIGYQRQFGNIVLGADLGFSIGGGKGSEDCSSSILTSQGFSAKCETEYRYSWNARARLGYATGNYLFYLTGGYTRAKIDSGVVYSGPTVAFGESGSAYPNGYVIGAGLEYVTQSGMRLGLSYTHLVYEQVNVNLRDIAAGGSGARFLHDPDILGAALKIPLQQQATQVADSGPPAAQAPAVAQTTVQTPQAQRPAVTPAAAAPAARAQTPTAPTTTPAAAQGAPAATTAPAAARPATPSPRAPVPGAPVEPDAPSAEGRPKK